MGWSDWAKVGPDGAYTVPPGRYVQWKAVLRAGGTVDSVGLNYLQKNVAPVVDEIVVQPGRTGDGEYGDARRRYGAGELSCCSGSYACGGRSRPMRARSR